MRSRTIKKKIETRKDMKKLYLKPELEIVELELESMVAATGGTSPTQNPSNPVTGPSFDESREFTEY
jgi:hypothetical protein